MLKVGIVCIGAALGLAVFLPREQGGLLSTVTLLVFGISLVVVSPPLRSEHESKTASRPESSVRRPESSARDSSIRGRHSAPDDVVADPTQPTDEPRQ